MSLFKNYIVPEDSPDDIQEYQGAFHLDAEYKKEQIREKQIKNETAISNLILRKMTQAMIESVGQEIQTAFVDFSRRESPVIAALLGIPHLERDLENILSKKIQVSIDAVKATCVKLAGDGMFE